MPPSVATAAVRSLYGSGARRGLGGEGGSVRGWGSGEARPSCGMATSAWPHRRWHPRRRGPKGEPSIFGWCPGHSWWRHEWRGRECVGVKRQWRACVAGVWSTGCVRRAARGGCGARGQGQQTGLGAWGARSGLALHMALIAGSLHGLQAPCSPCRIVGLPQAPHVVISEGDSSAQMQRTAQARAR